MTSGSDPVGTVDVALAHAERLLASEPSLAVDQAHAILEVVPGHPDATQLLADAWRAIGDRLSASGDAAGADAAYAKHIRHATRDPRLLEPAAALAEGRIAVAEPLLRRHLKQFPTDVAAIRMLAEVAARIGRLPDAEHLYARCVELAPSFHAARHQYAVVLHRNNRPLEALAQVEKLLAVEPHNPACRNLQAAVLSRIGEYAGALEVYERLLQEYPRQARAWLSYGHTLKTAGRTEECITAYRRAAQLEPTLGEVWWSLANLKTFRFDAHDVAAMQAQLARDTLGDEDRLHFHFALGKALEDAGDDDASFRHYAEGNRLRRARVPYDAGRTHALVERWRALATPEFLAQRRGQGCAAPDPIFIVGLPRSGSTLVEQILASHPSVEGTMELPDLIAIARDLAGPQRRGEASRYPDVLATLAPHELRELGERYLEQTRVQRKLGRPYFIDKLPNNWQHVGLIELILPNAKIVDARRHPLSCCFSNFQQHFARGQDFTYSLDDLGRYYADYVALMAHFDAVLPGRVHRVFHERMVDDTEGEVRRLLDHCGLPFDEACLRFYDNERAVRTASSEQVRRPINREGVDRWRRFAAWLGPLRDALGPVLDAYPDVPAGTDWIHTSPSRGAHRGELVT